MTHIIIGTYLYNTLIIPNKMYVALSYRNIIQRLVFLNVQKETCQQYLQP